MVQRAMQYAFTSGELSPVLGGRVEVSRYFSGLARCENYRTLRTGGVERRPGTLFVAEAKFANRVCRLERFEFSVTQAYVLEIGHEYIRFYADLGQIESSPGVPLEVSTPYQEGDLFNIQFVQSADVLYCVHPDHPPYKLSRLSATSWTMKEMVLMPPPVVEADTDLNTTLTPAAVSGSGVTVTAGAAVFLDADVDRQIVAGDARAIITALGSAAPSATATVTILQAFTSTATIAAGSWFLIGSPVASLVPDKAGPIGAEITLNTEVILDSATELINDGDFSLWFLFDFWDDYSSPLVTSGTATGGTNAILEDTAKNFVTAGVEVGHRVLNITDSGEGRADSISTTTNPNDTVNLNPALSAGSFVGGGDSYEIRQTGTATLVDGEMRLAGGENGVAWREYDITTEVGKRYRWTFDVRDASLTVQIGSSSQASDVMAEASYPVGNGHDVRFTATSTTTYLQVRNTQNTTAVFDNTSCKSLSATALRTADVGKYIQVHSGTVEITELVDAAQVKGVVWWPLDTDAENPASAAPGAWVLGVAAWSGARGYPRAISFHQGRLSFGGTDQQPLTWWLSASGLYDVFAMGTQDDQALEFSLSANTMNTMEWLEPLREMLVGTRGGQHLLTGGGANLSPTNVPGQLPQGTEGCAPMRPVRVGTTSLFFVQRGGRVVQEMVIDDDTGVSQTREITALAGHMTRSGLKQWAVQRQPHATIWCVREDGELVGYTWDLAEEVRGWHRHTTTGLFESVATVPVDSPSDDETEQVWLVVNRTVGGAAKRYIEVMRDVSETESVKRFALTVDSALQYRGAAATTFSGLDHLEGLEVTLVGREDVQVTTEWGVTLTTERLTNFGTQPVTSGQVTTPQATAALDVGLAYTPTLTTLKPEVTLQDGTLQMRKKRWVRLWVRTLSSLGLSVNGKAVPIRVTDDVMDAGLVPQDLDVTQWGAGWTTHGQVTLAQALPFPSTLLALVGDLEVEDVGP